MLDLVGVRFQEVGNSTLELLNIDFELTTKSEEEE